VRTTYDAEANAFALRLVDPGTYAESRVDEFGFILDFDQADRLIGIEVLNARERLPQEVLDQAEQIGRWSSGERGR
jgi:uncharacterized protein YuzE